LGKEAECPKVRALGWATLEKACTGKEKKKKE